MKVFPPKHPYLPKGCGSCPYGNGNGNVDTGHALYLLSYNPNNPQCQACMAIYKCISTFNDNEMKARLQSDLVKWYKSEMPEVMVGKFKARRFNVMFDGLETIINKNSYNEILNKGSHDELYAKRLVLAKKIHANSNKFRYQKGKDEAGIDHPDAIFKVFIGEIDGYNLKIKVKYNQDGNILWAMRII